MDTPIAKRNSWAWYQAPIAKFLKETNDSVIGALAAGSQFPITPAQTQAWQVEIDLLQNWLDGITGEVLLEFTIPRLGGRIDAVVLAGPLVFAIEFKVGATEFDYSSVTQAWDYALDLRNFHSASHSAAIVPLVVATEAVKSPPIRVDFADDMVCRPIRIHPGSARDAIRHLTEQATGTAIDPLVWPYAPYRPTPTIIEAARTLYARHSVHDIARHDAGAKNLHVTSKRVEDLIEEAKSKREKLICFVTGVPGAGKTLVGLNIATHKRDPAKPTHAVFLSGNGPLVAVLQEALVRDDLSRRKNAGESITKKRVANPVKAFIQNVHHFRDAALKGNEPPDDHVVIFDEAQRAWNLKKTAQFMKARKGQPNFNYSEPAFLISYMDRHTDWAVIVCLVGGGQEIHTGEAGIGEWLRACNDQFPEWQIHISENLTDSEYAAGDIVHQSHERPNAHFDRNLHLSVSMRSFRAEHVSHFVKALLDGSSDVARDQFARVSDRFPIVVTRDLEKAKRWIRSKARGSERFGLVASSKAMRLKPHAIDIRVSVDPVQWFLSDHTDTRSSQYLEDCATEFQVQGLELDWACVNWDGDFRRTDDGWSYNDFRGNRWERIRSIERQAYLRNAYRVLLTRARQGMVIFLPPGNVDDPTRPPGFYDQTFGYLTSIGIPILQ
jgi:hypothetical protein